MMLTPLCPDKVRKINGSFAFIEHRFLHDGFWADLDHLPLLLYIFLVIVSDRRGLSYYSYDKICALLRLTVDLYIEARDILIDKGLIAFDGQVFQVLALPAKPKREPTALLKKREQMEKHDPATICHLIEKTFKR